MLFFTKTISRKQIRIVINRKKRKMVCFGLDVGVDDIDDDVHIDVHVW